MAAHGSTGKQSWRSTDTPSRWTNATVRPTASGREMRPSSSTTRARARSRRSFPRIRQAVGLFVCGPTVLRLPGPRPRHGLHPVRLLARLPRTRGLAVTYVQNITDVDDKIIGRARELRIDASERAR